MITPVELDRLKSYVDIVALAESFGAEPRKEGRRYRTCCLWHSERSGSLVLYPDQGTYHCFGCGVHGDQVTMAQERAGTDFMGAVRHLAAFSGYHPEGLDGKAAVVPAKPPAPRVTEDKRRKWNVITPVPSKVPPVRLGTFEQFMHSADRMVVPVRLWEYRDAVGQLLGCDVRYEYEKDGKTRKDVITWTWCKHIEEGTEQWRMRAWDDPSPMFGLDLLAARPTDPVIVAEGCKAASAATVRTGLVGVSWRGGVDSASNFERVDWSPLTGRDVTIWPDADEPGHKAAWHIAQHLRRVGAARVRVVNTSDLPKGWDLADD